jgi:undecaprenyl-diphosphatase
MPFLDVVLLGILEGLTEFLPVSSTGHLILLNLVLGHESEADKTLEVVIQLGAVVAVVIYYRARLATLGRGLLKNDPDARRLALALAIAFAPAAVVGLAIHGWIKDHLFGPVPVAGALIAGGFLMIGVELGRRGKEAELESRLEEVTPKRALVIGLMQCLSLWPGTSRSMTTIVGGQISGLSTATAAEFSFLLAIPTLGAATVYDLYKNGKTILATDSGVATLMIGLGVSFVVALLVIAAFLRYLKRFGLAPFGVYRILAGALVLFLALGRSAG